MMLSHKMGKLLLGRSHKAIRLARAARRLSEGVMNRVCRDRVWPRPRHALDPRDKLFLFVLTPPFSGSTALAKVLSSAKGAALLQEKGEGQWLVPGLLQSDRWNPRKFVDWESVQAVWMAQVEAMERARGRVDVVIEKSPPNIVRPKQLVNSFPNSALLAFNRNPYANCASILYRKHHAEKMSASARIGTIRMLAECWRQRSEWLRQAIESLDPLYFTYEAFCSDPKGMVQQVAERVPQLGDIDVNRSFRIKDYPDQKIENQNPRQVAKLSLQEKEAIHDELQNHIELLAFFGYENDADALA